MNGRRYTGSRTNPIDLTQESQGTIEDPIELSSEDWSEDGPDWDIQGASFDSFEEEEDSSDVESWVEYNFYEPYEDTTEYIQEFRRHDF